MTGTLVLVSTPIGNLGDLPPRAVEALRASALICCEDTRRTGLLLQHAGVRGVPMAITNEHTESARAAAVLDLLAGGAVVTVVTDAGTPGIADPGAQLVRAALDAGFEVSAVPGPAALVMALVVSGFDTTRFVFEGFVPRSGAERRERLADISRELRTVVLYEAPHRAVRTIVDLGAECGGDRRVALARELTKLHEEVWRGTLSDAAAHLEAHPPRGEFVIVVQGASRPDPPDDGAIRDALHVALSNRTSRRDAVAAVTDDLGVSRKRVYDIALTIPVVKVPATDVQAGDVQAGDRV